MPIEQRVVAQPKIGGPKTGAKIGPKVEPAVEEPKKSAKGGRKKLLFIIIGLVVLLGGGAAVYFLVLAPSGDHPVVAEPAPSPGVVQALDPHSLNLADGHYLRIGLALQLTEEAGETELDPAPALDAAVTMFSGRTVAEVSDEANREQLRAQLLALLQSAYGDDVVMGVYFTDFVTQ